MRKIAAVCLLCVAVAGCGGPLTVSSDNGPAAKGNGTPNPPVLERVDANENTAGKRGKGYGGGIVTEPLRLNFLLRYKIVFLQIENQLKVHHALNGSYPESLEKFKEEIVAPLQIKLPELPPGHKYVFDSEKGKLLVERPQQ